HRAPALLSLRRFPLGALRRRARKHSVLGGHPPFSAAIKERRNFLLDRCGADHARVADFDQRRSFCMFVEVGRDAHGAQLIVRTPVVARFSGGRCCSGHDAAVVVATFSSITAPLGTTTIPDSVTVSRCRSSSRSYPIVEPAGIFTPLSTIVRRIFECRPISRPSIRIDSSTSE